MAEPMIAAVVSWLSDNSSAVLAASALVAIVITTLNLWVSARMAASAARSVMATENLIAAGVRQAEAEHVAAVQAVFYELAAIAQPINIMLQEGSAQTGAVFDFAGAYRQLLMPFHRGLPADIAGQAARTYSLLAALRPSIESGSVSTRALDLVYNDDLVPTLTRLQSYAQGLGCDLHPAPSPIERDGIVRYHRQQPTSAG